MTRTRKNVKGWNEAVRYAAGDASQPWRPAAG